MKHRDTSDPIPWARKINARWEVHCGLREAAAAWMDYLTENDAPRLLQCTSMAAELSRGPGYGGDPKPWFYGGLFSGATADEARRFVSPHPLTHAVIPATAASPEAEAWFAEQSEKVRELVTRVRNEITARREQI